MSFPVIKYLKEVWDRGVCHFYEDTKLEIAINQYKFNPIDADGNFHILISIDGRLRFNKYIQTETWEEAEAWAIEKAKELYE